MAGRDSPGSGSDSGSTISRGEVAQRADADGQPVLFIIDNEVYDVTPFLDEHPGGHEVLQNMAGRDASEDFADVGHSADAKEMMRKYHVGVVPEAERRAAAARTARWEEPAAAAPAQSAAWKLPLVLALAATLLYYLLLE